MGTSLLELMLVPFAGQRSAELSVALLTLEIMMSLCYCAS